METGNNIFKNLEITRNNYFPVKVVIVNGQFGCGKSMFSLIIANLGRVELLTYAYQLEYICSLYFLGQISESAAVTMVKMLTDLQTYNTMMGRETNFRFSDVSSVFTNKMPLRYIKRLFQRGDLAIPDRIKKEKPILHLNAHNLLGIAEPVFKALDSRLIFIEIVRHPLYMVKQQSRYMKQIGSSRQFTIYFKGKRQALPFYVKGWEELFEKSNNIEKAVYCIKQLTALAETKKQMLKEKYNAKILTIPFEKFVINPWPYMEKISQLLETKLTKSTIKMMKRQKVPRKMYADGVNLKIYKRCGWEPSKTSSEQEEFEIRREFVRNRVNSKAMAELDNLCVVYQDKYMKTRN